MVTRENVIERLTQLGYVPSMEEYESIEFELKKMVQYSLNYCNLTELPEIIEPRLIDRVCSEYLFYQKNSGKLVGFDYDVAVKSIKEGDVTVNYAVGQGEDTPENRFDSMVRQLERGYDKWLTHFRRLAW